MAFIDLIDTTRELGGALPLDIVSRYTTGYDIRNSEYRALQYAAREFSVKKPRQLSMAFYPDGSYQYSLENLVTGWNKDQFRLYKVVYPANDPSVVYSIGSYDQNEIDNNDWIVFLNPEDSMKPWLRILNGFNPGSVANTTLKMFLFYSAPHVVSVVLDDDDVTPIYTDTITDENPLDADAFCYCAVSRLLEITANYYANLSDATISMSVIDNQNKSNTFMQRSKDMYKKFCDHIDSRISPEGRIDWDSQNEFGGNTFWLDDELT